MSPDDIYIILTAIKWHYISLELTGKVDMWGVDLTRKAKKVKVEVDPARRDYSMDSWRWTFKSFDEFAEWVSCLEIVELVCEYDAYSLHVTPTKATLYGDELETTVVAPPAVSGYHLARAVYHLTEAEGGC